MCVINIWLNLKLIMLCYFTLLDLMREIIFNFLIIIQNMYQ